MSTSLTASLFRKSLAKLCAAIRSSYTAKANAEAALGTETVKQAEATKAWTFGLTATTVGGGVEVLAAANHETAKKNLIFTTKLRTGNRSFFYVQEMEKIGWVKI